MKGWRTTSAEVQGKLIADGTLTREQVYRAVKARVDAVEPDLKAFMTVLQEPLSEDVNFDSTHPLAGSVIAVKDVVVTKGTKTTCSSKMLEHYESPFDATLVRKLKHAGLQIIGKTNMDEFAMGSSTENSAFFPSRNPYDTTRVPGGSSGGTAAIVGSGAVALGIGTDTGGSIRQPAAFCGQVGLKPTYGRVSRYGLIAFASSLDQAGPMTTTVRDCALLLGIMAGHDPLDGTSVNVPVPDYTAGLGKGVKGMKIGWVKEFFMEGLAPEILDRVKEIRGKLEADGAEFVDISLPHTPYTLPCYYIIAPSEASSNLARYDGVRYGHRAEDARGMMDMFIKSRTEGFGEEVKRRIMLGVYTLSAGYYDAYYGQAMKVRRKIQEDFVKAFEKVDLIMGPATPTTAFKIGEKTDDPLAMYLSDVYTAGVSLAGVPGMCVPGGLDGAGLPIGVQLVAPAFEEGRMLQAAWHIEESLALEDKPKIAQKWMDLDSEKGLQP